MPSPVLEVVDLHKVYERPRKAPGLRATLRAFARPEREHVAALRGISFTLGPGEILGFIGPNGAGKTTTLKILAGVLFPTSGHVQAFGHVPWRREHAFLRHISFVMSGRGFLEEIAWDLSVSDGLGFMKDLYHLGSAEFRTSLDELSAMLDLSSLLDAPLRQLSHGQRARAELAAALIWRPRLLLLDEPTLGLDVISQQALRQFIRAYVRRHQASCVVTSHYMRDIEEMADRVVLIEQGRLADEGSLAEVLSRLAAFRLIRVEFEREPDRKGLESLGRVVERAGLRVALEVPRGEARQVAQSLLAEWPVRDLTIEEPGLERALRAHLGGER
ncbi:MAG: ABC transporter ATP-binding protein [Anaerolineae bacterium]|jgi:ABC-2 type transport system ATP-binding protein